MDNTPQKLAAVRWSVQIARIKGDERLLEETLPAVGVRLVIDDPKL